MKKILSENLNAIKAIAIILVVIYHLPVQTGIYAIDSIKGVLYCGVDIFILLAGFGLYHSLEKNDIGTYAYRRIKSILPYYLPFIIIFLIVRKMTYQLYLTEAVGNITMTGWMASNPGQFNWYVDAIWILYFIAPIIYGTLKKTENVYLGSFLMLALTFIISVNFWHTDYLILATRIPIFVLGFILADDRVSNVIDSRLFIIIVNIISVLGIAVLIYLFGNERIDRWHYGSWWYPFFMIIPGLCMDLAFLLAEIRKNSSLDVIDKIGKMTFSLYLWHIFIFDFIRSQREFSGIIWVLLAIGVSIFSIIYHILVRRVITWTTQRKEK